MMAAVKAGENESEKKVRVVEYIENILFYVEYV